MYGTKGARSVPRPPHCNLWKMELGMASQCNKLFKYILNCVSFEDDVGDDGDPDMNIKPNKKQINNLKMMMIQT